MRFGVVVAGPAMARAAWLDEVRRIDDLGFDLLLVPDHLGLPPPFPPLVAAAEASDRLRFGVQVLNNEFWNPVLLARDVIGVDLLTDGRLEVGLGAGHTKSEFDDVGIIYERPGVRISRLEHDVAELRWVLDAGADGPVGFAAAQGHVPIMVGGNGDRVLDIAARRADIVGLNGITSGSGQVHTGLSHFSWDGLADRIAHVRTCAPERFANLTLSILVQAVVLTDDRDATAEAMAAKRDQDPSTYLDSPFMLLGTETSIRDDLARLTELGVDDVTTFRPNADALAAAIDET
ncbi:MAG TPA: TIGR03621 family F420-dependent LLM class oxidoreductase [Acidimicrobiales bacterium]|nr:TIGR03621 family F420-dependent LLM class oxidoreductase [Acidimicrobiales bacterium]